MAHIREVFPDPADLLRVEPEDIGGAIRSCADFNVYRKGGILPTQLLQPRLADKVHHLFVCGDHDVAVFQAF
jgi:hypothetical protein